MHMDQDAESIHRPSTDCVVEYDAPNILHVSTGNHRLSVSYVL